MVLWPAAISRYIDFYEHTYVQRYLIHRYAGDTNVEPKAICDWLQHLHNYGIYFTLVYNLNIFNRLKFTYFSTTK